MGTTLSTEYVTRATEQDPKFIKMLDSAILPFESKEFLLVNFKRSSVPDISPNITANFISAATDRKGNTLITNALDGYTSVFAIKIKDGKISLKLTSLPASYQKRELKEKAIIHKGLYTLKSKGINAFDLTTGRDTGHAVIVFRDKYIVASLAKWHYCDKQTLMEDMSYSLDKQYDNPDNYFCMHPLIDHKTGNLLTFKFNTGLTWTGLKTKIVFYEFDTDSLVNTVSYETCGQVVIHGFSYTENYFIVFEEPIQINKTKFICGCSAVVRNVTEDGMAPILVHIIPRHGQTKPVILNLKQHGYIYHNLNAFEVDGNIVFDAFVDAMNPELASSQFNYDDHGVYNENGNLYRYTYTPKTKTVVKHELTPSLSNSYDFHCISGLAVANPNYRYIYVMSNNIDTNESSINKIDIRAGTEGRIISKHSFVDPDIYLRDVCFICKSETNDSQGEEDNGYLITLAYDAKALTTRILIYDAKNLSSGPDYDIDVARLGSHLPLPYAVHSCVDTL
jgi:all-trans-8'-apo-beta-carotenal 15,15'-oxygenase